MPKRKASGRATLGANNYGKSLVRLMKVTRDPRTRKHTITELSVDIALEGDFADIHLRGDNANCLPTDTMKNTVYALGKSHPIDSIEAFALHLGEHFVRRNKQVARAIVRIAQTPWERLIVRGRDHPHCFLHGGGERATCEAVVGRGGQSVASGITGMVILKSTDSAFRGYPKGEFTTLPETDDRVMCTSVTANWSYPRISTKAAFNAHRAKVRRALVEAFAGQKSQSVQHTLFEMGQSALRACAAAGSIRLSLPNKHCLLVNLAPFGLNNPNEVFVPTDEPHGLIEATIQRS